MMGSACCRPVRRNARMNKFNKTNAKDANHADNDDGDDDGDALMWARDMERHACGEFSFAVVQANDVIEDHSQLETGCVATFVGVYDGHGGPEASRFIANNLFINLIKDGFLSLVRRSRGIKPLIAAVGSCCLVGVIWNGTLHIANVGDSRAVLGYVSGSNKISSQQLSKEHNAAIEEVRQELKSLHPDDSQIVEMKNGAWRVKGIIQVSRSIGDAYLKRPEFSLDQSFPRFHLSKPLLRPVLTAEPSLCSRTLQPTDKFLIFASDGLWEHLSNQEAVEIVHSNPRPGIARRLIREALKEAARKREMSYEGLKKIKKGVRRLFHDDITVAVIYIDHDMMKKNISAPDLSIRGFRDTDGPSDFTKLQGIERKRNTVT